MWTENITPDWQVQSFLVLDFHRTAVKTWNWSRQKKGLQRKTFKIPIPIFTNMIHLTLHVANMGIAQQQKSKFSLPGKILTGLCNTLPKNKSWFPISHEQNNSLSCKYRHRYYIGIVPIFEQLTANFSKAYMISRCCTHETWSLEVRMISAASSVFVIHHLLLRENTNKKVSHSFVF